MSHRRLPTSLMFAALSVVLVGLLGCPLATTPPVTTASVAQAPRATPAPVAPVPPVEPADEHAGEPTREHASHPLIASTSPDHYRFSPIYNGEVWDFGKHDVPEHGANGWTYEIRFWNSSKQPVRVSGFQFSAAPDPGHMYGWQLVTGDTLYVDNDTPRAASETIELKPEEFFRISVNFGYDRHTAPADYVATLRVQCDPGGPFEIKVHASLVAPAPAPPAPGTALNPH